MIGYTIRTKYKPYPGSNNGSVQATLRPGGMQRTVRIDQALRSEDNHQAAAARVAEAMNLELAGEPVAQDDGGYLFTTAAK